MHTENPAEDVEHALALLSSDTMKRVTLSRRQALQGMLLGAAGMSLSLESFGQITIPPGEIRLIFNENPYGPSPKALAEVAKILPKTAYYPDDIEGELIDLFMERLRLIGASSFWLRDLTRGCKPPCWPSASRARSCLRV